MSKREGLTQEQLEQAIREILVAIEDYFPLTEDKWVLETQVKEILKRIGWEEEA